MDSKLALCLKLNKRMPPTEAGATLENLMTLTGREMEERLCQNIDVPLGIMVDRKESKKFVTCTYNRDADYYRSPHTNTYYPRTQMKLFQPSHPLRVFEVKANKAFNIYRALYFKGGVASVYCWDLADRAFASSWVCKNEVREEGVALSWSEIHVFEVKQRLSNKWNFKVPGVMTADKVTAQKVSQRFSYDYNLTTTVIMETEKDDPMLQLSGKRTLQKQRKDVVVTKVDVHEHHVAVMGRMAEELSSKLRASLARVYCPKANEILSYLHQNEKDRSRIYLEALRKQMKEAFKSKTTTE